MSSSTSVIFATQVWPSGFDVNISKNSNHINSMFSQGFWRFVEAGCSRDILWKRLLWKKNKFMLRTGKVVLLRKQKWFYRLHKMYKFMLSKVFFRKLPHEDRGPKCQRIVVAIRECSISLFYETEKPSRSSLLKSVHSYSCLFNKNIESPHHFTFS